MPQLDFFIFNHIILQTISIFITLLIVIWNTAFINIFKALKTRNLFIKNLNIQDPTQIKSSVAVDELFDIHKEVEEYKNKIKAHE